MDCIAYRLIVAFDSNYFRNLEINSAISLIAEKKYESVLKNLGPALKRLRTEKGITQVELGQMNPNRQSQG